MSRQNAALRRLANTLAPKVQDTRKFKFKKPPVFDAFQAKRVADAVAQTIEMTGNPKITIEQFILSLIDGTFGEAKGEMKDTPKSEANLAAIFNLAGGSAGVVPTVASGSFSSAPTGTEG